jgi:hypothetical protein
MFGDKQVIRYMLRLIGLKYMGDLFSVMQCGR